MDFSIIFSVVPVYLISCLFYLPLGTNHMCNCSGRGKEVALRFIWLWDVVEFKSPTISSSFHNGFSAPRVWLYNHVPNSLLSSCCSQFWSTGSAVRLRFSWGICGKGDLWWRLIALRKWCRERIAPPSVVQT